MKTDPALLPAQDAATSPTDLQELSLSKTKAVRRAVAQNPNTPLETLYHLGEEFPKEFLENPGLPLLLLENPRLFEQTPPKTLAKLLQLEELPAFFVEKATYQVMVSVLRHKHVPLPVLRHFAKTRHDDIRERVAKHPCATTELLAEIALTEKSPRALVEIATNERASAETLARLALQQNNDTLQFYLAKNPNINEETQWVLFTSKWRNARKAIEGRAPQEWLQFAEEIKFPRDNDLYELPPSDRGLTEEQTARLLKGGLGGLFFVSTDQSCAPKTLDQIAKRLAEIQFYHLSKAIVEHPNLSEQTREELGASPSNELRQLVAKSLKTPASLLEKLIQDSDLGVIKNVATNPNTPAASIEKLLQHSNYQVRESLAHNPNATAALIERLANDESFYVQAEASKHSLCSKETLLRLSKHSDSSLLYALASNPRLTEEAFENLCNSPYQDSLLYSLTNNPSFPLRLIEKLKDNKKFRHYATWSGREEIQETVIDSKSWKSRETLARGYSTTAEVLAELAKDKTAAVRAAVAFNTHTKKETIAALCLDKDEKVRTRALVRSLEWRESVTEEELLKIASSPEDSTKIKLAAYEKLPATLQERLSKEKEAKIRANIAKQKTASPALLRGLVTDTDIYVKIAIAENANTDQETLLLIARGDKWAAAGLTKNPNTPEEILEELARCKENYLRHQIAQSPHTPKKLLEILLNDPEDYIQRAAKEALKLKT